MEEAGRQKTTAISVGLSDNQRAFLAAYVVTGTVSGGARAADVHRDRHYTWLESDPAYAAAFKHAVEEAADNLEEEARRRAFGGLRKYKFTPTGMPILHPETGQPYYEEVYSDTLIVLLLKALRPEKYRDNSKIEHAGEVSTGPILALPDNGRGTT